MTSTTRNLLITALSFAAACGDASTTIPEVVCADPSAVDAVDATELYLAAWSEEDPFERACMVQRSLAADAVLIDTAHPVEGRSAVMQHVDARVGLLLAEGAIREAGSIESRHDEARIPWVVTDQSGMVIERGEDWLEFNEDGLLFRIHTLAGPGTDAPVSEQLLAWQRAWNASSEPSRTDELRAAATEDVRFTDLLTDVQGRAALVVEIQRQQEVLGGELRLDDRVEVFATADAQPILIRQSAQIVLPQGGTYRIVNYVRLRDGRIERLSGFPSSAR